MGATTTPAVTGKIAITIDGQPVTVTRDSFLLAATRSLGIEIPTLCYHKDLTPTGICRLCVCEVEVRGKKRLVTSCNYPLRDEGLKVETRSPRVLQHRRLLAEMYLGRWPNVPVIQEIARICGVTGSRFQSELTDPNPKACILCGHCVRACEEFVQERILDFAGRGIKRHLTMPYGEVDPHCVGCSSCAYVCPTGAIEIVDNLNHPVNPQLIRDHGMKVNAEMATLDRFQNCMRKMGTANIVQVMDKYDLLPCHNYKFGSHKDSFKIDQREIVKVVTQDVPDGCWKGCSMSCAKAADDFELRTGPYKGQKVCVDAPEYETAGGAANMGCFDLDFMFEFAFYCDTYGIDVISAATTIAFVMEAFEAGVINESHTGGKRLRFGALQETLELLHEMARGEGFGVDVGQGVRWLKRKWVKEYGADASFLADIGMEVKGLEVSEYMAKESLAQQAGYAMAVKGAQHDEAWLIFMDMVNNQIPTFEDKANALYYFPLWRTWFGLMGLCKLPWNDISPADNKKHPPPVAAKIPEHVENYYKLYEGVTGKPLDEEGMLEQSARVHNLQRLLCYMLGGGTRETDMPPYRLVGPVTREEYESRAERYDKQLRELVGVDPEGKPVEEKLAILRSYRMDQYNKVVDAAYRRRGWDPNGVPTEARLKELGIDLPEVMALLKTPR
jgi:aldehyde:ferredoxin oxidoreductase